MLTVALVRVAVWTLEADDYGEDQEMIDEDDLLTAVLLESPFISATIYDGGRARCRHCR